MQFGHLKCDPISVSKVIASPDLDGQHMAVHGIIYYGEGCGEDEYLLLPKEGPFDGVGPIPMPAHLDRSKCILIEEPHLYHRLGGSSAAGAFLFKDDAILVGQIRRRSESAHPVRIGDLWLIVMQRWADEGLGWTHHNLRVILFPQDRLPPLPWSGYQGPGYAYPLIRAYPPRNDTERTAM
jgi:hypothetical protein